MTNIDKLLNKLELNRMCLIPRPGADVPSCHEYTLPLLCDHEVLTLVKIIRLMADALLKMEYVLKNNPPAGERFYYAKECIEQVDKIAEDIV